MVSFSGRQRRRRHRGLRVSSIATRSAALPACSRSQKKLVQAAGWGRWRVCCGVQGRFCGRLLLKKDEKLLVEECQRIGHLLGGASGGTTEEERRSLAAIARAIASGDVRRHLEQQKAAIEARRHPSARPPARRVTPPLRSPPQAACDADGRGPDVTGHVLRWPSLGGRRLGPRGILSSVAIGALSVHLLSTFRCETIFRGPWSLPLL